MADGPVLGLDCKLYYNSGTHASPTWVLIDKAIDVNFEYGTNAPEIKARNSINVATLAGLIKHGGTFTLLHSRGTDSVRAALLGIISGRAPKELAFMDQAIATSGAIGARFFANLETMNMNQPLEEGVTWDVAAKPAYVVESSAKVEPDIYIVT